MCFFGGQHALTDSWSLVLGSETANVAPEGPRAWVWPRIQHKRLPLQQQKSHVEEQTPRRNKKRDRQRHVQRTRAFVGGTSQQWRRVSYVPAPRAERVKPLSSPLLWLDPELPKPELDWQTLASTPTTFGTTLAMTLTTPSLGLPTRNYPQPRRCQVGRTAQMPAPTQHPPPAKAGDSSPCDANTAAAVDCRPVDVHHSCTPTPHSDCCCTRLPQPCSGLDLTRGRAPEQSLDTTKALPFPCAVAPTGHSAAPRPIPPAFGGVLSASPRPGTGRFAVRPPADHPESSYLVTIIPSDNNT